MVDPLNVRVEGPAPAMAIAFDLARRSLWVAPVIIIVSALFWGVPGVLSTSYGVAIVVANFLLSAYLLAAAGRINAALMAGAAMFGFLLRLALIAAAVLLVRNAWWVELVPLGLTLIVAHLVLLFWEMKYVSGTAAFPGLKPKATVNPFLPSSEGSVQSEGSATAGAGPATSAQNAQ